MNRHFISCVALLFVLLFMLNCSSVEKKNLPSSDNQVLIQKTDIAYNNSNVKNSFKNKVSTILKPSDFIIEKPEIITFSNSEIKITLYARRFAQGNGVYAEIENPVGSSFPSGMTLLYKNESLPLTKTSWGYRSLWGIDPEEKPGYASVIIKYNSNGKENTLESEILIRDVNYPVSKSMLNVGKFSDRTYTSDAKFKDWIVECSKLREKAFSSMTEDSIQSVLSYPRDMHKITGDYWRARIYLSYQKKGKKRVKVEGKKRFHRGVDLKGGIDAPVYAMADGVVVLSHKMFYEGNMVIIDHGNQVFSYYQHMNSLKVKDGDRVRAGELLGGVGDTGMVTGPHLHLAFSIRGVHVDPLSILSLPVSR